LNLLVLSGELVDAWIFVVYEVKVLVTKSSEALHDTVPVIHIAEHLEQHVFAQFGLIRRNYFRRYGRVRTGDTLRRIFGLEGGITFRLGLGLNHF